MRFRNHDIYEDYPRTKDEKPNGIDEYPPDTAGLRDRIAHFTW